MLTLTLLATARAHAGGPLAYSSDGAAVGWDVTSPVPYHVDLGGLGLLSNAAATSLVDSLFEVWEVVPTSTISFTGAGHTAVDIDETNFGGFLDPATPIGQNVIVFDEDGAIFDLLYGVGTTVLGFAGPSFTSDGATTTRSYESVSPGSHIVEGYAFLNGKMIDGIDNPGIGNLEIPLATFGAVFIHEFGHFSGLHHTQIHGIAGPPDSDITRTQPVETMFPFLFDASQGSLERDDIVAISSLYASPDFHATTVTLSGRVLTSDGAPLTGINVIARNVANDAAAVSYVSGTTLNPAGAFVLAGLSPGAQYTVEVQEIDLYHQGGSRLPPFSHPIVMPGPPEFYSAAESASPIFDDPNDAIMLTGDAGSTIGGITIVLNRQVFAVENAAFEGHQIRGFALGDYDEDGRADFVSTQTGFDPGNLTRFHRGLGNGHFAAPTLVDAFPGNNFIVSGQFNSGDDSHLDLVVASTSVNEVRLYLGDGAGGFSSPATILDLGSCSNCLLTLEAGDLNGDSFDDLFVVFQESDSTATVNSLLGSISGAFTPIETLVAFGGGLSGQGGDFALGDIAGDAAVDAIGFVGYAEIPELQLLIGDGSGGFVLSKVSLGGYSKYRGRTIALADFDEDGSLDVAYPNHRPVGGPPNFTRSFIDLLTGDGDGHFGLSTRYQVPEPFSLSMVAADFDGDHHVDLASTAAFIAPGHPGAKVNLAFGNGAGGVREQLSVWGVREFPSDVMVSADFDGDERPDLLVNSSDTGNLPGDNNPGSVLLNRWQNVIADVAPDLADAIGSLRLRQNLPNPFEHATSITFDLPRNGVARMRIYDVSGRLVRSLVDGPMTPGPHSLTWDGRDNRGDPLAAGVYFYRLDQGDVSRLKRMVLLR